MSIIEDVLKLYTACWYVPLDKIDIDETIKKLSSIRRLSDYEIFMFQSTLENCTGYMGEALYGDEIIKRAIKDLEIIDIDNNKASEIQKFIWSLCTRGFIEDGAIAKHIIALLYSIYHRNTTL